MFDDFKINILNKITKFKKRPVLIYIFIRI